MKRFLFLRRLFTTLCVLCSLAATAPIRAAIKPAQPVVWSTGLPADLSQDPYPAGGVQRRYGPGWYRVNPLGHLGVLPEVDRAVLNQRIAAGTLPQGAKLVLAAAGHDGAPLTDIEWLDLFVLRYGSGTYMSAIFDAILAVEARAPQQEQVFPMQRSDVEALLLAAGDPRALDAVKVAAVAEEYGKVARVVGIQQLVATLDPAYPNVGAISAGVLALFREYEAAFAPILNADEATQAKALGEQTARLERLLTFLQLAPAADSTASIGLNVALARRALETARHPVGATDAGRVLDALLKQSERQADALKQDARWAGNALSTQRVVN